VTVTTDEKTPQQPSVAELEEAITHLTATCKRYGPFALKYGEWHEEINHLLDDREKLINLRPSIDRAITGEHDDCGRHPCSDCR
jgi:hypothetical protein